MISDQEYLVALGSNIEPRVLFLEDAIHLLGSKCGNVLRRSSWLETEPIGAADRPFLNGAAILQSDLQPQELLTSLQCIESHLGRKRVVHWGNRTIDLDIILWRNSSGCCEYSSLDLTIPHKEYQSRAFVLEPMAEIAGDWDVPPLGGTISEYCLQKKVLI